MEKRKWFTVTVILAFILSSCAPAQTSAPTLAPIATSNPLPTQPATSAPTLPPPATLVSLPAPTGTPAPKPYIAVIAKGYQGPYWETVKFGAQNAAAELNVEINFMGPADETMVDSQVAMLKAELDKKPAAICLAAIDSKALLPSLQIAQSAKIPIIAFDSGIDSDIPLATAATDNIAAGALIADKMAAAIGGSGKVGVIAHDQTSSTGIDRVKGFVDQMKAKYPKVTVLAPQYGNGDPAKSYDLVSEVITANPGLKGFYATNQGSAMGLLFAVGDLKMGGKLVVIGFDSGQDQLDAIQAGIELGAITQDPISMGYKCVQAAVDAIHGKTLPKTIDTGFHWYDKANIDDPAIADLLYR